MPRRLIDKIARLDPEKLVEGETQSQEQSGRVRVEPLHLESDLDRYIEALEKHRLEILSQIRKLLHELRELNKRLRRTRMLRQISSLK